MKTKLEGRSHTSRYARQTAAAFGALLLASEAAAFAEEPGADVSEAPARRILISIPYRRLAFIEGDTVLAVFPVAVGKSRTPTPAGTFSIANRLIRPTWYMPGKIVSPGAGNPLGTRWIGLSLRGFGIHGTNSPRSIGRAVSHGCIRMSRADVEKLFRLVEVGDLVEIRSERDELTAAIFAGDFEPETETRVGSTPNVRATRVASAPKAPATRL